MMTLFLVSFLLSSSHAYMKFCRLFEGKKCTTVKWSFTSRKSKSECRTKQIMLVRGGSNDKDGGGESNRISSEEFDDLIFDEDGEVSENLGNYDIDSSGTDISIDVETDSELYDGLEETSLQTYENDNEDSISDVLDEQRTVELTQRKEENFSATEDFEEKLDSHNSSDESNRVDEMIESDFEEEGYEENEKSKYDDNIQEKLFPVSSPDSYLQGESDIESNLLEDNHIAIDDSIESEEKVAEGNGSNESQKGLTDDMLLEPSNVGLLDDDESCIDRLDEADAYDDLTLAETLSQLPSEGSSQSNYIDSGRDAEEPKLSPQTNCNEDITTFKIKGTVDEEKVNQKETKEEEESYLLESFISQLPDYLSSESVHFVITRRMRRVLMNELNYSAQDVSQMRPRVAALVIQRNLQKPTSGMPQEWRHFDIDYESPSRVASLLKAAKKFVLPALSATVVGMLVTKSIENQFNDVKSKTTSCETDKYHVSDNLNADNVEDTEQVFNDSIAKEVDSKNDLSAIHENEKPRSESLRTIRDLDDTWLDKLLTRILDRVSLSNK